LAGLRALDRNLKTNPIKGPEKQGLFCWIKEKEEDNGDKKNSEFTIV
jgi:hypothetical protein